MKILHDWLDQKLSRDWLTVRNEATIEHEWKRNMGARKMFAGLSLRLTPAASFLLLEDVDGVPVEYVTAARNGIFSVLVSAAEAPVLRLEVRIKHLNFSESHSSSAAFFLVAKEATELAWERGVVC
jgi:hypothetical protein